jgi:hypothetical protein
MAAELRTVLRVAGEQHRDVVAVSGLQRRMGVDIDDTDRRAVGASDRPKRREHLVAEVAIDAGEKGQCHLGIGRSHRGLHDALGMAPEALSAALGRSATHPSGLGTHAHARLAHSPPLLSLSVAKNS